jgi:ABC-type uncharacterized transport system substrate-binding protein
MLSALRRRLVLASTLAFVAVRLARAQGERKVARIGVLMPSTAAATAQLVDAFAQGLRENGYLPGNNIDVLYLYSEGNAQQVPQLARELVRARVAVIVTTTDAVAREVVEQASGMPVVVVNAADPVGSGLVATLAHPGGSVTGLTNLSPEITGKRVQLLKECVPAISRLAYLWNPQLAGAVDIFAELQSAVLRFGLELQPREVRRAEEIAPAFTGLDSRSIALLVQAPNPLLYTQRTVICSLAKARAIPSIFNRVEYVEAGGLLSYGPSVPHMYRRAALYVDRILNGVKPGDLPVEQPSKFELVVNRGTARAIGIAVPQSLLARADRVLG